MVCKNCGNQLRENEKFCTICGTYNDPSDVDNTPSKKKTPEDEMENNNYSEFEEFSKQPKTVSKKKTVVEEYSIKGDPYIAAYIGEDYKWVVERPFNIYALLLSWIYFLYRKVYLIGIIGLIITGLIIKYVPIIIIPYIVLSMVGSGLFFNKIYLDIVESRVQKIESKARTSAEIEAICKKKGGVNVFIPLLIFFVFLVIMLLSYININTGGEESKFWSENSSNQANCLSMGKKIYKNLDSSLVGGNLEELACEITVTSYNTYNIYIKLNKDGNYRYLYFQNDQDGHINLKGNTDYIATLENTEKQYGLSDSDKDLLTTSRELSNKFASIKDDSDYEDNQIFKNTDTKAKTHYVFTKDDILR